MVNFEGKIFILGCGGVAQCTIPILLKLLEISPSKITVMDFCDQRARVREALDAGVHYVVEKVTPENYQSVLSHYLSKGDLFIDLSWNVETLPVIDWCHQNGVLYVNTSVELWEPYQDAENKSPTELTLYHRQMALRRLATSWGRKDGPTAILDHGANPGLVSHFTKQALIDIGNAVIADSPKNARSEEIKQAIASKQFGLLAYLLGVKTIHISERDSQVTNRPKERNEFVNTWSIPGLIEEGIAPAELGWGTHEYLIPRGAMFHEEGPKNQICLPQKGMKTWVRSWVPSGEMTGMVIRHGEAFSISDYLTVEDNGKIIYRPTVHYAYCPCDSAINSLHEIEMRHYEPQTKQRILSDDIIKGEDELGCLLMGHDKKAWWIGSVLSIEEARQLVPGQNATTVQVAIGVVAAAIYAIRHPNKGLCLPDQLDHEEILEIAMPYLGRFISMPVDWSPLDNAEAFLDYNELPPNTEEMWQFSTFLISPKEIEEEVSISL